MTSSPIRKRVTLKDLHLVAERGACALQNMTYFVHQEVLLLTLGLSLWRSALHFCAFIGLIQPPHTHLEGTQLSPLPKTNASVSTLADRNGMYVIPTTKEK